jgi:hypothetical protein
LGISFAAACHLPAGISLRIPWAHERLPKDEQERRQFANQVGRDGRFLLDALAAPDTPDWMKTLPAIDLLRTMWDQQFTPQSREVSSGTSQQCPQRN